MRVGVMNDSAGSSESTEVPTAVAAGVVSQLRHPTDAETGADADADADAEVASALESATAPADGVDQPDADTTTAAGGDQTETEPQHQHQNQNQNQNRADVRSPASRKRSCRDADADGYCDCAFAEAGLACNADLKSEFLATFTLVPPSSASQSTQEYGSTAVKCAKRRLLVQHSRRPVRATRLNCAKQENPPADALRPGRKLLVAASGELLDSDEEEAEKTRKTVSDRKLAGGLQPSRPTANTNAIANAPSSTTSSRWIFNLQTQGAAGGTEKPVPSSGPGSVPGPGSGSGSASGAVSGRSSSKYMLAYASDGKRAQGESAAKAAAGGGRRALTGKQSNWNSGVNTSAHAKGVVSLEKLVPVTEEKNEDELDESSVEIDIPTGLVINSLPDVAVKPVVPTRIGSRIDSISQFGVGAGVAKLDAASAASRCFSLQKAPPTQFYVPTASTSKRTPVTACTVQPKTFRVSSKAASMLPAPASTSTSKSASNSTSSAAQALRSKMKQPVAANANAAHLGAVSLMKLLPNSTVN